MAQTELVVVAMLEPAVKFSRNVKWNESLEIILSVILSDFGISHVLHINLSAVPVRLLLEAK